MDHHLFKLVEQLRIDFESNTNGDLEIHVKGQKFKVSRHILCLRSPVFAAMFQNDTKENQTNVVEIHGFDPELVKKFLLYLYTAKIDDNLDEIVVEMFQISDYYDVKLLRDSCLKIMWQNVNNENVLAYFELAEKYSLDKLKKKTRYFLACNVDESTMFKFYEFAKKYYLEDIEKEVMEFIVTNLPKLSLLSEWKKFDGEFRLKMFQEFFDQGPVIEVMEKIRPLSPSSTYANQSTDLDFKCYTLTNTGKKILYYEANIVKEENDAEVTGFWTENGFIDPNKSEDITIHFKKPNFHLFISYEIIGKKIDDDYFGDNALVRQIKIDPKNEYPLI